MRRSRSPSPKRAGGDVKRINRSELQSMIQAQVLCAVRQTEAEAELLLEKVQQLRSEPEFYRLEAHIKKVGRRGDAALAFIQNLAASGTQENQSHLATLTARLDLPWSDPEEETLETASENPFTAAVRNALSHIKKERASPPPLSADITALGSPQSKKPIKKELLSPGESAEREEQEEIHHETPGVKEEPPEEQEDDDAFPTLPPTLLPSILSEEAASYSVPQQPSLKLALIRNPPGLSVLWDVEEIDPAAPPMDSYCIFMAIETGKGSGVFPEWKTLGEVPAGPLPMCVMISKFKPGYRVCFSVVGKDRFGRYGPYSKVIPGTCPEGSA